MDCTTSITNFAASYTTIYLLSKIPGNTIMDFAARICRFAVFYMIACVSVGFLYSMILLFANQPLVLAVAWLWWGIQFWGVIVEDSEVLEQMVRANFVDWPEILLARVDEMGWHG
ncbi:hypothetical protein E8E13_007650 [Curvularia kusanoi]|uniref:Uncharacterized protein n=1 Tax=Curvularia kusanoi TaxID=90978 RepID=A0A9P4TB86_CURKU|nr:hypothetical protein E8E13_007650 [Curvularia kusanoi]